MGADFSKFLNKKLEILIQERADVKLYWTIKVHFLPYLTMLCQMQELHLYSTKLVE
jgi:hypothetical protein